MVRIVSISDGVVHQGYQGSNTVFGLTTTLINRSYPNMGVTEVFAEGNAIGKGPVVLNVPAEVNHLLLFVHFFLDSYILLFVDAMPTARDMYALQMCA